MAVEEVLVVDEGVGVTKVLEWVGIKHLMVVLLSSDYVMIGIRLS
jgi:hypothetical protein